MRTIFPDRSRPTDEQFSELWKHGNIVFDTCALTRIYKYHSDTRKLLFSVMEHFSDQLWLPHHVALEFRNVRKSIIRSLNNQCDTSIQTIEKFQGEILKKMECGQHSRIQLTDLREQLDVFFKDICAKIEKRKENTAAILDKDEILDKIIEIFNGKIGRSYSYQEIFEIQEIGEKRYRNKIPPGYEDIDKRGRENIAPNIYGDLIIWFQIIEHAKASRKPIIFVTEDTKEDWWNLEDKDKKGPRPELIEEIKGEAGVDYYSYTIDRFITYGQKEMSLADKVVEAALSDINQVRTDEEKQTAQRREFIFASRIFPHIDPEVLAVIRRPLLIDPEVLEVIGRPLLMDPEVLEAIRRPLQMREDPENIESDDKVNDEDPEKD